MQVVNPRSGASDNMRAMELEQCLTVGLEVFLDASPRRQASTRIPAFVRGWEPNRYLLFGPAQGVKTHDIRPGKGCAVRFINEGEVWGFTAICSAVNIDGGVSIIHFHWPREVARVQVRKFERVTVETPCTAVTEDGSAHQCVISDLSGGGCSLMLETQADIGASLRLTFQMPDGGQVFDAPIDIRNRKVIPGKGIKYGCQFRLAEEKSHPIGLFVARKIAVGRGESAPHGQIIVLSPDTSDVEVARRALTDHAYEVIEATGILDLGHRLRTCSAAAILINAAQKELEMGSLLSLIRHSAGMESILLVVYGDTRHHEEPISASAAMCLTSLEDVAQITHHLPRAPAAAPRESPAGDDTPVAASGAYEAESA